ncbi:MAG TPA: OmpH family outer membrane protein [Syntrophales bacterium]|nr:OmpH family outer membrane protein [Syntrophales bacterium]
MNRLYTATILWIVYLCFTGIAMAESRIGFVDMNRIIQQSSAGITAMKDLAAFKESKNKTLTVKHKYIQGLKSRINQRSSIPGDPGLAQLQKEFQDAVQEYNKLLAENEAAIQKKDRELTHGILEDVSIICHDLQTVKHLSFVFDKSQSGIIVFPPENDLTQEVIKRYDAKYRARGK